MIKTRTYRVLSVAVNYPNEKVATLKYDYESKSAKEHAEKELEELKRRGCNIVKMDYDYRRRRHQNNEEKV